MVQISFDRMTILTEEMDFYEIKPFLPYVQPQLESTALCSSQNCLHRNILSTINVNECKYQHCNFQTASLCTADTSQKATYLRNFKMAEDQ